MSNFLSCGPTSLSNSSEYDKPEHPPPLTPMRRNTFSRCWAVMSCLTCFAAFSVNASAMIRRFLLRAPVPSPLRCVLLSRRFRRPLLPVVEKRRLDRVLGENRAVNLHGRQLQLV